MNRTRWIALAVAVAVLAIGGVSYGMSSGTGDSAAPARTSTTAEAVTTSTPRATTSTTSAATKGVARVDDGSLGQGAHGPAVEAVQRRLAELHLDPGPVDGGFGQATAYAVEAFEKLNGMAPDGRVSAKVQTALADPAPVVPLVPNGGANRVEIDLPRQLLFLYKDGALRLVSHVSTGTGQKYCVDGNCNNRAITPIGSFRFAWRATGWHESRLGKLYNPVFFTNDGVAVHGSLSVPTYPASHGCVRIPMHIAEYFPTLVKRGDPVYVTDGRDVGPPPPTPSGPAPVAPPTSPGDDTTTTMPPSTTTTTQPTTTTTTQPTTTTSPTVLP